MTIKNGIVLATMVAAALPSKLTEPCTAPEISSVCGVASGSP